MGVCVCACVRARAYACRVMVGEETGQPVTPQQSLPVVGIACIGLGAGGSSDSCDLASSLGLSFIICQLRGLGIRSPRLMSANHSSRALFQVAVE